MNRFVAAILIGFTIPALVPQPGCQKRPASEVLPFVGREKFIKKFCHWQQLSVGRRASQCYAPIFDRSHCRLTRVLPSFALFFLNSVLDSLLSSARGFGDRGNEIVQFIPLQLGRGQDCHRIINQTIDGNSPNCRFC